MWLSVDSLAEKYFGWSPYNYCMQNPINYTDPDGRWVDVEGGTGDNQGTYRYDNGNILFRQKGSEEFVKYEGQMPDFVSKVVGGLNEINSKTEGNKLLQHFSNDKNNVTIQYEKGAADAGFNTNTSDVINIDPDAKNKLPTLDGLKDADFFTTLGHELGRHLDPNTYFKGFGTWTGKGDGEVSRSEIFATHIENMIRAEHGISLRTSYEVALGNKLQPGLDFQTLIIDKLGNSLYFNQLGKQTSDPTFNQKQNVYDNHVGKSKDSGLLFRFNYYKNAKKNAK